VTPTARAARAVVSDGRGAFAVEDITVDDPQRGEVLVEIKASGICHTDHDLAGAPIPFVLGHEGAGVVRAIGDGVEGLAAGDRVMLSWSIPCGACFQCVAANQHLCERNSPLNGLGGHAHVSGTRRVGGKSVIRAFSLGTLSTLTLVRAEAVVPLPDAVPFTSACIAGCGVMTGFGSVVNAAKVVPGASVVVLGCGGVGLNVIQGARISGATKIIAVDTKPVRLEMALRFGATETIEPATGDADLAGVAKHVHELTGGRGADYAFECTAVPELGAAPLAMIRHGGTAVQVSGIEQPITIDMRLFEWDKTYINPLYGQCRPGRDFPRLFDLYAQGDLLLDELVTTTYALDDAAQAFADMLAGRNAKGVIVMEDR
jgi:S-(hydroxymethyl)glutathione dehydrogenase/alcohol dehydrogenase